MSLLSLWYPPNPQELRLPSPSYVHTIKDDPMDEEERKHLGSNSTDYWRHTIHSSIPSLAIWYRNSGGRQSKTSNTGARLNKLRDDYSETDGLHTDEGAW